MLVGRAIINTNNKTNVTVKILGHEFNRFNKKSFDVAVADTLDDFGVRGGDGGPPSVDPPPYSLRGECPGVVVIDNDADNAPANFKSN